MNNLNVPGREEENNKGGLLDSLKQVELQLLLNKITDTGRVTVHKFRIGPDGTYSMPFATSAVTDIYGLTAEEIMEDFSPAWSRVHPDDRARVMQAIEESTRNISPFHCEWRVQHPTKGEIWVDCRSTPELEPDGGIVWYGYFHDITDLKRAEQDRITHLHFLESMDLVNQAIHGAENLDQMMSDVLDALLGIFDCDRAWLLYPCDPDAETWHIPMERTRPEYPGLYTAGRDCPMDPHVARNIEIVLNTDGPVGFGPGLEYPFPGDVPKEFNIQSTIAMAMYPKIGKPWMYGLHQCSRQRIWTAEERRLFSEIGRRLSDGLTGLLASRNLRESERRLADAENIAHVGWWHRDYDADYITLSNEACHIFGLPLEEQYRYDIVNWHDYWLKLIHPEDRDQVARAAENALQGGPRYDVEYRIVRPDGDVRIVYSQGNVEFDESGKPRRMFGIMQDITGRKRAEEALRVSEERFRQAFEFAGIGMGILSVDGRWLRANHTICEMLGYSEDELCRTTYQELTHPDDLVRGRDDVCRVIEGEIPYMQIEKRYRHKDGHYVWARLTTSVVRSEDDKPLYFVSQVENIDQRKRAEQEIVLLSFALNRVREGVYLMNEDARFSYINNEACQVLGYSREELLNMSVPDIDPDYQMGRWREHWRDIKDKGSVTLETMHRTKSGHLLPVEVNANYIEYNGTAYNLALVRDISERKRAEEALRRSEADLRLALDAGHLGDWKWDIYNNEITWSSRCKSIYGLPENADITYDKFLEMIHPDDRENVHRTLSKALRDGNDYEMEKRIILPDGSVRWTIGRGRVIYNDRHKPALMAGIMLDITERKLTEQARHDAETALRESDERFRQMAENIQEVFWLTDAAKTQMLYVSAAYETIWGRTCESLYNDPLQWIEAIHPDDRERVRSAAISGQVRGEYDVEYKITRPDGTVRYIHDRAVPIRDDNNNVYRIAGIAQDITSRKETEAHIQYLAYHDVLTDLPNRGLVMNRLKQAIAQAYRQKEMLAVLFFDLDRFKTINDTLGHHVGDTLLQQAGKCLTKTLRKVDTVGRVGGDEFLILLPSLSKPDDAIHVCNKIIESFSAPFNVTGHELHVTASIGISIYPRDTCDPDTLVKYADTALYLAKEQGRNTYRFFSPELDARVRARLHIENDLRGAINRNELQLHYQPILDVITGKPRAAEVLLRWQHPEFGMVAPADFIPVAEETGQIIPIGEWVLQEACSQARKWQDAGLENFRLSVNLSRRQLEHTELIATIKRILEDTDCAPGILELEITESSAMYEPEQAIPKLLALHDMGIRLALDDYGTGYSSLAYLKRFPFDRLKIDRSFVEGIPDDCDDIAIVQTTIVLARQLRLKVVAEGVETEAQLAFLREKECDEMQGYLFAQPMLPAELEKYCGLS